MAVNPLKDVGVDGHPHQLSAVALIRLIFHFSGDLGRLSTWIGGRFQSGSSGSADDQ